MNLTFQLPYLSLVSFLNIFELYLIVLFLNQIFFKLI